MGAELASTADPVLIQRNTTYIPGHLRQSISHSYKDDTMYFICSSDIYLCPKMLFSPIQNSHFDLPFLIDPDKHIFLDAEVEAWILEVGGLCVMKRDLMKLL